MFADPVVGKFTWPVMKEKVFTVDKPKLAFISKNTPLFQEPSFETFKIDPVQLEVATDYIIDEIKRVYQTMKKDKHISDPDFLKKLDTALLISDEYQKLTQRQKHYFVQNLDELTEDLSGKTLMQTLEQYLLVKDQLERDGKRTDIYSNELFQELVNVIAGSDFSVGIIELDEVEHAIRANGIKRKKDQVFIEPFLAKKRKTKGRGLPPAPINTNVKKRKGPQVRKTPIAKPLQIPIVREQRNKG